MKAEYQKFAENNHLSKRPLQAHPNLYFTPGCEITIVQVV